MQTAAPSIFIVDDDPRTRELLEKYLAKNGYVVQTAEDGRNLEERLTDSRADLLVLDLMLPGEDGLTLCRRLRSASTDIPIIMLTARGEDVDRIVGLEMGADDYLAKPFNPRELMARINAVLRRHVVKPRGAPATEDASIRFGECVVHLGTRQLVRGGKVLALTTGEFAVLEALVRHPRKPLSREKLMELSRGREHEAFDRSMDVQISRLRRLIEAKPAAPRYIQTVRGYGYVFVPETAAT
jgi:two-component system phosphate regulon response regulator OmpR